MKNIAYKLLRRNEKGQLRSICFRYDFSPKLITIYPEDSSWVKCPHPSYRLYVFPDINTDDFKGFYQKMRYSGDIEVWKVEYRGKLKVTQPYNFIFESVFDFLSPSKLVKKLPCYYGPRSLLNWEMNYPWIFYTVHSLRLINQI